MSPDMARVARGAPADALALVVNAAHQFHERWQMPPILSPWDRLGLVIEWRSYLDGSLYLSLSADLGIYSWGDAR